MAEKMWKVKDLIKYFADFNPNAWVDADLQISWQAEDSIGDIEQEKANTEVVFIKIIEWESGDVESNGG